MAAGLALRSRIGGGEKRISVISLAAIWRNGIASDALILSGSSERKLNGNTSMTHLSMGGEAEK